MFTFSKKLLKLSIEAENVLSIMATFVKKNGIKPISNGTINNIENVENLNDNRISLTGKESDVLDVHVQACLDDSDEKPELDIIISNVVCSFSVRCHLNLREIALNGSNVEYRRENGLVRMRLRKPCTLASISSSGKVTCTGATSEDEARKAARRCARSLQKLGFRVKFNNYRIVNVLGTCTMPWAVKITSFSVHHKDIVQYEPEIQPGVIYKLNDLKATLRIFSTGSVTVTAPSISAVQAAIEHIYPLVYEFRKDRSVEEQFAIENKRRRFIFTIQETIIGENEENNENFLVEDDESENSDTSWS